ncbi:hypothetical protein L7F22_045008 [Adiantum nelumboides]|nr:hypothetical protein [Adiantum nelumboides]
MAVSTTSGMSLANVLWNRHRSQAMMALYHPFVVSLSAGVLDISSFRNYIVQDALFLKAYSTVYRLLQDNVDDDSSKLIVNHLIQGVRDEPQLHSSYAEAWGVDLSIASHPNEATVKYTEFLLATASSEERKKGERTSLDRQRLAAFTVGALTPCMRLYAFLGQEIKKSLGEDSPDTSYHQWIDTYSSKEFQSSTLQIEVLLDTLAAHLDEDDISKLENLYSQAFTLELEFFSAQPNCQCTLLPFIRRQIDGSDANYLLMADFDVTCSVTDSCSAPANVSVQAALKINQDAKSRPHQKPAAEIRRDILEKSYSEHYSRISIPPEVQENCDRFFNVDGLRSFLERLSEFELNSNTEAIRQGVFEGLNLEDGWNAGCDMVLREDCTHFLRQVSSNHNVNVHIVSVCWSKSFAKGALAKEGLEHVEVHSNELITSGSCTSGDIKRVVGTPFDKERIFEELMHSTESPSKSGRSIYIGDSVTDLLCLLKADMGIVIGSNSTLQKVSKAFGVLMMPLYKGVLEMAKLGNARGGKKPGVIYTCIDFSSSSTARSSPSPSSSQTSLFPNAILSPKLALLSTLFSATPTPAKSPMPMASGLIASLAHQPVLFIPPPNLTSSLSLPPRPRQQKVKVVSKFAHSPPKLACPGGNQGLVFSTRDYNQQLIVDEVRMTVTVDSGRSFR